MMLRREEKVREKKGEKGNMVAWLGTLEQQPMQEQQNSGASESKNNSTGVHPNITKRRQKRPTRG
jgi:hypothetical protein